MRRLGDHFCSTPPPECPASFPVENPRSPPVFHIVVYQPLLFYRAKEPSEFDEFDEPEECQGHIPKRTPKSGSYICYLIAALGP